MADAIPQRQAETLALMLKGETVELSSLDPSRPRKSARITLPSGEVVKINGATWMALKQKNWVEESAWKPYEIGYRVSMRGKAALEAYYESEIDRKGHQ